MINRREWLRNMIRYGVLALISGTVVYLGARTSEKQNTVQCTCACSSCGAAAGCDQNLNTKSVKK